MRMHAPLIIDIAGTSLTDADRARLAHPLVGGIILFKRNWEDRSALVQLCADIKAVQPDLLICVDHEGGRVQRRTDGFTHIPPMRALARCGWMTARAASEGSGAMRAMNAATAGYVLGSCAPAVWISASPRCWTWTMANPRSSATAAFTATRAWWRPWPGA
jgi:beta-N-acetylhexosaminidase